jgi:hypothetical protein
MDKIWTSVVQASLNGNYLSITAFMYEQKCDKTGKLIVRSGLNGEFKILNLCTSIFDYAFLNTLI